MKILRSHSHIERSHCHIKRSHCTEKRITSAMQRAGLVLGLICLISELALPGYCLNQQSSSQSIIAPAATSAWANTGTLNAARRSHSATLLPDGKVLVAGGDNGFDAPVLKSAELYDPANQQWSYTGSLNIPRLIHTATLLPNGKVLVAGGSNDLGARSTAPRYTTLPVERGAALPTLTKSVPGIRRHCLRMARS